MTMTRRQRFSTFYNGCVGSGTRKVETDPLKTCPLCETAWPSHHTSCPTDGALLIESRDLEPGTLVRGKYRIVRQLGRGGMGTVYLAEHILLGRMRALKFISSALSQNSAFLRRFRREAQAAIELRHPNIVEVVDLDQAEDGAPYMAMEYVVGPDLRHAMLVGAFSVERALAIARGLALGLGAAHSKGIIHRDVKPENILLAGGKGASETPKLLDFGIAAITESTTAISHTRGLMLTPRYAAPEQWRGMAAEDLDGCTDLYALGGVLYEMLTGRTPFQPANGEGWMDLHLHEQPHPPSQFRAELSAWTDLDALVLRLLAKKREDRPRNVEAFIRQLDAVRQTIQGPPTGRRGETFLEDGRTATVLVDIDRTPTEPRTSPFSQYMESEAERPGPKRRVLVLLMVLILATGGVIGTIAWKRSTEGTQANALESSPDRTSALAPSVPATQAGPAPGSKRSETQSLGQQVKPERETEVRISCDLACNWKVDRSAQGRIESGESMLVTVSPGQHVIAAQAADERLEPQQKTVAVRAHQESEAPFQFNSEVGDRNRKIGEELQRAAAKYTGGDDLGAVEVYDEVLLLSPANQAARDGKAEVLKDCKIQGISCEAKK
jgi:serine/threonine protein kinase